MSGDYPNYCIFESGQSTEKTPGYSNERPSVNAGVKNSQRVIILIMLMILMLIMIMLKRPEAFLEALGVSGPQPCAGTT